MLGIAEQPLEVALRDGAEVAVEDREGGKDDEQVGPVGRDVRHGDEQHAEQQGEAGGFRADGQKRGHRRGRSLIDIRGPDLEGKGGDLEAKPDQHEDEAKQEDRVAAELRRHCGQFAEVERMGDAIDQRDAEHGKGGGEGADDQVFDAGFERGDQAALEAGEHVEGDGDEFQRHEQQGEVVRRGGKQHARERKQNQRVELGDAGGDAVGEFDRHEQDDEGGQQEEAFEEQRQAVERVHLAEGVLHWLAGGELDAEQAVEQDQAHADARRRSRACVWRGAAATNPRGAARGPGPGPAVRD